jgi:Flp pilus assembly protein TadG
MENALHLRPPGPGRSLLNRRRLVTDEAGAMIVEAAIVLPITLLMLSGVIAYGSWFMVAHSVQQAANEGAQAALAGLNDADRQSIAQTAVSKAIAGSSGVESSRVSTGVARSGTYYTVTVSYDAANSLWQKFPIVPTPTGAIRRQATVQLNTL